MLLENEKKRLVKIENELRSAQQKDRNVLTPEGNRVYFDTLRSGFRLFEDVIFRANKAGKEIGGEDGEALRALVSKAILKLGGVSEPNPVSLKDYDHHLYGPFLGVSDEGSAARIIRCAALSSPKMKVLGTAPPIVVGVAHDAERLAAVGEVAVGPEEYRDIILDCQGSILVSTNVGTRLNLRYYKIRPIIRVTQGPLGKTIEDAIRQTKRSIEPFWLTPDGNPRPVTILPFFERRTPFRRRLQVLNALRESLSTGSFCDPKVHRLALLADVKWGSKGLRAAKASIDLSRDAGLKEVAIQGEIRWEAENKISMPGLLNYFRPEHVSELIDYARNRGIVITPKNLVDPDTVARNVWSSLQAARNMGLQLGKYGLFPLTFEESDEVMRLIQHWFPDWTAAPVLYIDFPHLSKSAAYTEKTILEGAKRWLDLVASHGIPVVLIDTADKDKGRKLLKTNITDRIGILTLDQVSDIEHYANEKEIRCLWAGGITLPQALELGRLKVFGIYVTTSAAAIRPVSDRYARDPMITAEREPTFKGVYRTKLLLEVGFLISRLQELGLTVHAEELEKKATAFLRILNRKSDNDNQAALEKELAALAVKAWEILL